MKSDIYNNGMDIDMGTDVDIVQESSPIFETMFGDVLPSNIVPSPQTPNKTNESENSNPQNDQMWNDLGDMDATPRFVNFEENMAKPAPTMNGVDGPTFENFEDNAVQEAPAV